MRMYEGKLQRDAVARIVASPVTEYAAKLGSGRLFVKNKCDDLRCSRRVTWVDHSDFERKA